MTDLYQNPVQPQNPTEVNLPIQPKTDLKSKLVTLFGKLRDIALDIYKSKSGKIIVIAISSVVLILFVLIIAGLIFGRKNNKEVSKSTPSPRPTVIETPVASSSGDVLSDSKAELKNLYKDINNWDIDQSKLKAPDIDFDIKFDIK